MKKLYILEKSVKKSITLRPKIYELVQQQALREQLSFSRYIEQILEKFLDECWGIKPYPKEPCKLGCPKAYKTEEQKEEELTTRACKIEENKEEEEEESNPPSH